MLIFVLFLCVPLTTLFGGFQTGALMGDSRSFSVADPLIYGTFVLTVFTAFANGRKILDRTSWVFVVMIIVLLFSAVFSNTYMRSEFLFPFKNFCTFLFIYIMGLVLVTDVRRLKLVLNSVLVCGLVMCLQMKLGFSEYSSYDIATNRALKFAGGLTWNSLVATISLVFPIALFLLYFSIKRKKNIFVVGYSISVAVFVFTVVLSGGRQALGSIVISTILFVLYAKGKRLSLGDIVALVSAGVALWLSFWFVDSHFQTFAEFSAHKRDSFLDDLWEQRILAGLWYPLIEYDYFVGMLIGDGWSNKHNILTTVLYRFGIVGSILFWLRFYYLGKDIKRRISQSINSYKKEELCFPLHGLFIVVFISFMQTNIIANIWHQVVNYGYLTWVIFGALSGVALALRRDGIRARALALKSKATDELRSGR